MAALPYASGDVRVSSPYGTRQLNGAATGHAGVDLVGTDKNVATPVSGTVVQSRMVTDHSNRTWEWGNYVTIAGDDGNYYIFAHMSERGVGVGQRVEAGQIIGVEGDTGYSFGSHLHFEVRAGSATGAPIDPTAILGIENRQGAVYSVNGSAVNTSQSEEAAKASGKRKVTAVVDGKVEWVEPKPKTETVSSARQAADTLNDSIKFRHTDVSLVFNGVNVSKEIQKYIMSVTYTDNEEDMSDTLSITLQDKEGLWLSSWMREMCAAAASEMKISAAITKHNWQRDGSKEVVDCGEFELGGVSASQPPSVVSISATAVSIDSATKQTKKNKMWENVNLQTIASEVAKAAKLELFYDVDESIEYERIEQYMTSDLAFLSELCHRAGVSLKVTDKQLVLFSQKKYENQSPIRTIGNKDGSYSSCKLTYGKADTLYKSCRVVYQDPSTGEKIEGKAVDDSVGKDNAQCLVVSARVKDEGEANSLAKKMLRLRNKFSKSADFTFPGDVTLQAGCTVQLTGFGGFDDTYIIKQAVHSVSASGGYTTKVTLRVKLKGI